MKMKKLLLFTFLLISGFSYGQADLLPDSNAFAQTLEYERIYIDDTTSYCNYFAGDNFKVGYNAVIYGDIVLACMGDQGHADFNDPARTTAYLGIPNVTPNVYKNACGQTYYDHFCNIEILDKCGNILAQSHKFYYSVAYGNWYAVGSDWATGKFYYEDGDRDGYSGRTARLTSMFGELDTMLAYAPLSPYRGQAMLPANTSDVYSGQRRNSVAINNNEVTVGGEYYIRFYIMPEAIGINQGVNKGRDGFTIPFTFKQDAAHVDDEENPNGYFPEVGTLAADPIPVPPANIKLADITKGKQININNGSSITWDASAGACSYIVDAQVWFQLKNVKGWKHAAGFPKTVYSASYTVNVVPGKYEFSISAQNISGVSETTNTAELGVK